MAVSSKIRVPDWRVQPLDPLDAVPVWGPFPKVGEADRLAELLKRLPLRSRFVEL
jgi:hypothetical protein